MQLDTGRTEMERHPKRHAVLLAIVVFACCAICIWRSLIPSAGWYLSVQVAEVHVTFGTEAAPVRKRTPLSGSGQWLVQFGGLW